MKPDFDRLYAELLTELEGSLRRRDVDRARSLEQQIRAALEHDENSARRRSIESQLEALVKKSREQPSTRGGLVGGVGGVADKGTLRDSVLYAPHRDPDLLRDREQTVDLDLSHPAPPGEVYPVWFGTNRKPQNPTDDGPDFTSEIDDEIHLGRALVFVPQAHRFGETGSPFWKRLLRFDLRDDRLRVQGVEPLDRSVFYADLAAVLSAAHDEREPSHALVYLHGYKNTFEEAAIRAAQIGFDLQIRGATAFFSWPSRGAYWGYPADEAAIEASEGAITHFLADFAAHCGADKVHVLAHSMGNRGLLRALQRIAANAELRSRVRFGQIFLAAPDVDRRLFLELAHLYRNGAERTTLYASRRDLAVWLSQFVHDSPRVGYYKPYTVVPGIDTIAVPNFNVDLLGHSYYAQAEALLYDIRELLSTNGAPKDRARIRELNDDGSDLWTFHR